MTRMGEREIGAVSVRLPDNAVGENRCTHSLNIPQYSVGSSAIKKAKLDGSLFKFFVESLRLDLSFLEVFNRSSL